MGLYVRAALNTYRKINCVIRTKTWGFDFDMPGIRRNQNLGERNEVGIANIESE
jgi:hypothetical protein